LTKIKFIVDSACDMPLELVERHNIRVLPAYVNFNGESYADDGDKLNRTDYYNLLGNLDELPTTSSMSAGVVETALREELQTAEHVVMISVAATLSGIHNAMRLGAKPLPPESYTLFDTETVSAAAGLQAVVGAEVAEATGDIAATHDALKRARAHSVSFAAAPTLEYLRRGGRVSWTVGMLGGLLQIRPVVAVHNGKVESVARARKYSVWLDGLAGVIRQSAPLERIVYLHANNEPALDELRNRIADILPEDAHTITVTPSVGTHVGPGSIGAGVLSASWRD